MTNEIALVPYRLSIAGIPEIEGFESEGVSHVISFLDPELPEPESLHGLKADWRVTFRMHDIIAPEAGQEMPTREDVERLLEAGQELLGEDINHLLIHCHMGTSRSTAAAAIILAQHNPGGEAEALAHIRRIRRPSWPNSLMLRFADELLGRDDAFSTAVKEHYREMAAAFPGLADYFLATPRAVEVPDDYLG